MRKFAMKDLGKKKRIGIDIKYNKNQKQMGLHQSKYLESLIQKYQL